MKERLLKLLNNVADGFIHEDIVDISPKPLFVKDAIQQLLMVDVGNKDSDLFKQLDYLIIANMIHKEYNECDIYREIKTFAYRIHCEFNKGVYKHD